MFAQAYQSGFVSLLSSVGSKPLQLWEKHSPQNKSAIGRVLDDAIQSAVIQIGNDNGTTTHDTTLSNDALVRTWLRCPAPRVAASLHIRLPQLIFQLKRVAPHKHCSIEIQVEDHTHTRRRLRMSTFQRATVVHEVITVLPLALSGSQWNQLQLDLPALVRDAYGTRHVHTVSVCIHAHCRVRRVFFAEQMQAEDALPVEFRLFKRLTKQQIAQLKALDDENNHQQQQRAEDK